MEEFCLCGRFEPVRTKTRIHLVLHAAELKKASNTGRIAHRLIAGSVLDIHGHDANRSPTKLSFESGFEPVLLFPSATEVLAPSERPLELVVLDATWRQALGMSRRIPDLRGIRRARLPDPSVVFVLRRGTTGRLSTIDAVIQALALLEGEEAAAPLRRAWKEYARALLAERGKVPGSEDYALRDFADD